MAQLHLRKSSLHSKRVAPLCARSHLERALLFKIASKESLMSLNLMPLNAMRSKIALSLVLSFAAGPAFAHTGHDVSGFVSGFLHPLLGLDHVIAMVAVGLWAALQGRPATYLLPAVFPLVMAIGGFMGIYGIALPYVEPMIAVSGIVLGLMVAFYLKPAVWVSALMVGVFAVFHGHAHGAELPVAASAFGYAGGFLMATTLLHLAGLGFGYVAGVQNGAVLTRAAGVVIAITGAAFLAGAA
jgi:urease accessory protein